MNKIIIPKYIETGSWECSYSLDRFIKTIESWMTDENSYGEKPLETNPDFQRGHVWTEQQQVLFMEALLSGGAKNAQVIYLNNPNWLRHSNREYKDFVCVDGLQRYTAIKMFIEGKIKPYGYSYDEYNIGFDFRVGHQMRININDLPTKKDVLKWYLEMNSMGTPHTKEEIEKVRLMIEE